MTTALQYLPTQQHHGTHHDNHTTVLTMNNNHSNNTTVTRLPNYHDNCGAVPDHYHRIWYSP